MLNNTHKKEKSVNQSRTKLRTVNIRGERWEAVEPKKKEKLTIKLN